MSVVLQLFAIAIAGAGSAESSDANLVSNPSFEKTAPPSRLPAGWNGPVSVYSVDTSERHSGSAALKFVNDDPKRYALCAQRMALRPGRKYRFSVWAKTQDLKGPESGATICLEWKDRAGKWLGGSYPSGIKGTRDWTRVEEIVRVPKEAASFHLLCYVRKGMTGTAWFDDVQLVPVTDPPMRTILLRPAYRGRIAAKGPSPASVRVRLDLRDYDLSLAELQIHARLRSQGKSEPLWQASSQPRGPQLDLTVPTEQLPAGEHEIQISLVGPEDRTLQKTCHQLVRMPSDFCPRVAIDDDHRLLVDGQPFLPLGMYWGGITEEDLKLYARSKFNCLMPYGSPNQTQMDLAERYGLKVIYSIKDWYAGSRYCPKSIKTTADEEPMVRARVRQYRDHPALLAWYLNDELSQSYLPQLRAHQRWVVEEDPNHPTWVVLYQVKQVAAYLETFDVIGTDPYPIGRSPASMAAEWTAETFRQVEKARPMWQVPQAHNWANYRKDPAQKKKGRTPSFEEMRSMAWQCLCEGATGLIFYSWFDIKRNPDVPFETQWNELKRIAAEIDQLAPVLLSTEPAPKIEVLTDAPEPQVPAWLHWRARRYQGKLYLFVANDGDGAGKIVFRLPVPIRSIRELSGNRALSPQDRQWSDELPKLAVSIYEIELAQP